MVSNTIFLIFLFASSLFAWEKKIFVAWYHCINFKLIILLLYSCCSMFANIKLTLHQTTCANTPAISLLHYLLLTPIPSDKFHPIILMRIPQINKTTQCLSFTIFFSPNKKKSPWGLLILSKILLFCLFFNTVVFHWVYFQNFLIYLSIE